MVEIKMEYQGDKHCELIHGPSGKKIETDAPKDNQGKGECFSPTDLVAAGLGSCVMTIMAMKAEQDGYSFKGARVRVEKHMTPPPRRIAKMVCEVQMPAGLPLSYRKELEEAGDRCPVRLSLPDTMELPLTFVYPD